MKQIFKELLNNKEIQEKIIDIYRDIMDDILNAKDRGTHYITLSITGEVKRHLSKKIIPTIAGNTLTITKIKDEFDARVLNLDMYKLEHIYLNDDEAEEFIYWCEEMEIEPCIENYYVYDRKNYLLILEDAWDEYLEENARTEAILEIEKTLKMIDICL